MIGGTDDVVQSSFCNRFGSRPTQTVAGEIEAMGIVHEAIENGVGVSGVPEHIREHQFSNGSCLMSRSQTRVISCSDIGFPWCRSGRRAVPATWP